MDAAPTAAEDSLGEKIHKLRRREDLTMEELAAKIGVDESTLRRYERDRRLPNADALKGLAEALNTTSDYLLGLSETPSSLSHAA